MLGLDAPELETCPTGCDDAGNTPDAGSIDGARDGSASDAPIDQGPVRGLPCGSTSAALIGCEGATPLCCQTTVNGAASYECRRNSDGCDGFAIGCWRNDGCSGSNVCCHTKTEIACTGEPSCADEALVCDPGGPDSQCPNGWTCSGAVVVNGQTLPYHACAH